MTTMDIADKIKHLFEDPADVKLISKFIHLVALSDNGDNLSKQELIRFLNHYKNNNSNFVKYACLKLGIPYVNTMRPLDVVYSPNIHPEIRQVIKDIYDEKKSWFTKLLK